MSSLLPSASSASVRNILTLLASRDAQLAAGAGGLERRVTWASPMRVRLPAFESVQGGEIALLTLSRLRRLNETLPHLLHSLHQAGVSAVAVGAPSIEALGKEAISFSDQHNLPLILLPDNAQIDEIAREVIYFVVSFRGEIERQATEIARHLMQLSVQGVGAQGVCDYLANQRHKWVVIEDAEHEIRNQGTPAEGQPLPLSVHLSDQLLRQQGMTRVAEPIMIRHEIVGYISLIGEENNFDYLERIILRQVTPILAMEVARERERNEVENRYHVEAFTNILQGRYQQQEEVLARARILGFDLTTPQVVAVFEGTSAETELPHNGTLTLWGRRVRDELQRVWPGCWVLTETRRVVALLPIPNNTNSHESENDIYERLQRVEARLQLESADQASYSCGTGRIASDLASIPQSYREAQQALEIGRRLFGEGKLHSFSRLGVYRLLFHLDGHSELTTFYQETLGALLNSDSRNDGTLLETLECFFRCNGNLSETARTMHLHRNSLLYRLGRIEELLGSSLEDAELRLSLQIALKIHHLRKR
ncbi:helix-turn-helix domain-containing protein [Ktedonospora formicarum]|nr:helix-turn-helix domain-containing protein [Ktedonospora formicarum]